MLRLPAFLTPIGLGLPSWLWSLSPPKWFLAASIRLSKLKLLFALVLPTGLVTLALYLLQGRNRVPLVHFSIDFEDS